MVASCGGAATVPWLCTRRLQNFQEHIPQEIVVGSRLWARCCRTLALHKASQNFQEHIPQESVVGKSHIQK